MAFEVSYIAFLFPILLAATAVYFFSGRGVFLISGYNTLPKEEQERYNVKELTRAMGIFTMTLAVLTALTLFAGLVLDNSV
ncbi:MAG: DUF3784 domain-containing protein [Methanosarcinales archaeon]|jgi:hypothetical protein|nr:DUF3784 domain-containing protein [Methanosarcinales archaeon]